MKLSRKMPPVAAREGNTVRFIPEIAGNSIPPETAIILREKIRTLLLNAKAGGIQLVDGPADTVIKCIVTEYEPKTVHPGTRKVGIKNQKIQTWIGNIGASVQVLDRHEQPIDSANVKNHLENDFVVSEQEDKVSSVGDKKASWKDKIASGINIAKGGDKGDMVKMAGGGQAMHDAVAADDKGGRPPTDGEWKTALVEGLASKVANRIVPVDQEFIAILPNNKEFAQIRDLAKGGRWGNVMEQTEQMSPLSGGNEAYRQYVLGLAAEATAYQDAGSLDQAVELLNKASKYYDDAHKAKQDEREIFLAQIRAQDSLDHYLEIQHYLQSKPKSTVVAPQVSHNVNAPEKGGSEKTAQDANVADNSALVSMVGAGLPESVLLTYVQTAADPKFDSSANGLMQLGRGKVSPAVIQAVQKRMAAVPARRANASSRAVGQPQPVH